MHNKTQYTENKEVHYTSAKPTYITKYPVASLHPPLEILRKHNSVVI